MKYDLSDAARELAQPRNAHYPVKQRGERRRLNPNWEGIRWLEGEAFLASTASPRREGTPRWEGTLVSARITEWSEQLQQEVGDEIQAVFQQAERASGS